MKINLTLTNEEIQAVNESVLETTTDLSTIDITEPTSELMKNGDVISIVERSVVVSSTDSLTTWISSFVRVRLIFIFHSPLKYVLL